MSRIVDSADDFENLLVKFHQYAEDRQFQIFGPSLSRHGVPEFGIKDPIAGVAFECRWGVGVAHVSISIGYSLTVLDFESDATLLDSVFEVLEAVRSGEYDYSRSIFGNGRLCFFNSELPISSVSSTRGNWFSNSGPVVRSGLAKDFV